MTEEKKETTLLDQTVAPAVAAAPAPAPEKNEPQKQQAALPKEQMSKGEKWFNRIVYQGLNYWANLGISLVITDFFLNGKGKYFFHSGVAKSSAALTKMGMTKKGAVWLSEIALGTFSLNSGGNILLVPTKYLEDNKRSIVHWLNDKLGVDQTAPDGHKETPDEIYIEEEQEKQSWPRMIGRRVMGWAATTTVGLTLDRAMAKELPTPKIVPSHHIDTSIPQLMAGEKITHVPGQQVFTEKAVGIANKILGSGYVPGGKAVVNSPAAQRYMGYAALDWIYTIITSKVLHATNGAKKKHMPHELDTQGIAEAEAKAAAAKTETADPDAVERTDVPKSKVLANILSGRPRNESYAETVAAKQAETEYRLGV